MSLRKGEKPILFSLPMVQAILVGKKTQTRRLAKFVALKEHEGLNFGFSGLSLGHVTSFDESGYYLHSPTRAESRVRRTEILKPKYQAGDLLWVREKWRTSLCYDSLAPSAITGHNCPIQYADGKTQGGCMGDFGRWRSSLHMPRWASRLTLKVIGVKVERLKDISREDAAAEGICYLSEIGFDKKYKDSRGNKMNVIQKHRWPEENFGHLWQLINGAKSWESNPWVFAYEFEVTR